MDVVHVITQSSVYRERARLAYAEYMELQARIDVIEARAVEEFGDAYLAGYQLKTQSRYKEYRRLCVVRDVKMQVTSLNAQMALL